MRSKQLEPLPARISLGSLSIRAPVVWIAASMKLEQTIILAGGADPFA